MATRSLFSRTRVPQKSMRCMELLNQEMTWKSPQTKTSLTSTRSITALVRRPSSINVSSSVNVPSSSRITIRSFESESEYHPIADSTLDTIQDTIDDIFDPLPIEYEVTVASGVLTLSMPPHGTWVLNKQTPNRQIWVSAFEF
jgi:frataxin